MPIEHGDNWKINIPEIAFKIFSTILKMQTKSIQKCQLKFISDLSKSHKKVCIEISFKILLVFDSLFPVFLIEHKGPTNNHINKIKTDLDFSKITLLNKIIKIFKKSKKIST